MNLQELLPMLMMAGTQGMGGGMGGPMGPPPNVAQGQGGVPSYLGGATTESLMGGIPMMMMANQAGGGAGGNALQSLLGRLFGG